MSKVSLTLELRQEYENLFNTCIIKASKIAIVEKTIETILTHKTTYHQVEAETTVPWFFIGAIHSLEASLNFKTHLHNGDPLTARTVQVPKGRPTKGSPPFSWIESAVDALTFDGLSAVTDWSLANTLFNMEKYNGWGYRSKHPEVLSPYLWSYSTHYTSGKYVADGTWSSTAVSNQIGGAVILRRMAELSIIDFPDQPSPKEDETIIPTYSMTPFTDPSITLAAIKLQEWLNTFPGIFVKTDGVPGQKTSDAYKKVTGRFLPGDPRA